MEKIINMEDINVFKEYFPKCFKICSCLDYYFKGYSLKKMPRIEQYILDDNNELKIKLSNGCVLYTHKKIE